MGIDSGQRQIEVKRIDNIDSDLRIFSQFVHDQGGWLMMPLALALLGAELKLLSHLFIDPPAAPPVAREPAARRTPVVRTPARARKAAPPAPRERPRVPAKPTVET